MKSGVVSSKWFEGIYLTGRFGWFQTGCWLLVNNGEAAILELPPAGMTGLDPATAVQNLVSELSVEVKYLLCTHGHPDHFSKRTFRKLRAAFPHAEPCLQRGFRLPPPDRKGIRFFDEALDLSLAGEPLFLVHAPKHSWTDTVVIFRGIACTGDWELGTIKSVHDWIKLWAVPRALRLHSIERLERFSTEHNYVIHGVYSVHANDKREGIDFLKLIGSTREERPL